MPRVQIHRPRLTPSIDLPGGQDRLRQMILYVSMRCDSARRFGLIKLNKTIWKADFDAYAAREMPVTGRAYQRLELGPAPKEMRPLLDEMVRFGEIEIREVPFASGKVEQRPLARVNPDLSRFSRDDLRFVDAAIKYYWDKTGTETSDDSHGIAWQTRNNGDPMPYELSRLSDEKLNRREIREILHEMGIERHQAVIVPTQRRIEYSDEFNAACEQFGGIKAVDALIAGLVEALDRDPDKFFVLDQEHGLRYARVKRGEGQCDLVAIFEVDADRDVIFRGLRELTRPVYNA